jgi:tRNA nucleotidyltransferase (CCA-adding enzyme)
VLERIRPTPEEKKHLSEIANCILSRIQVEADSCGLNLKALLVGSAARGTWLSEDHDLDIFLGIPIDSDLSRALELAKKVVPEHEERYAAHPYIHAKSDGFDVDLVPCYLVDNAANLKSAVDRTPFHTKYVASKIAGLEDDVLLLKQFMKGIGVYGSELKVGGFSGYLTELLILRYGSFPSVLQAAMSWMPGEIIDLESHISLQHYEPLVVVDPVDPKRNVAAALTIDRMFQFVAASRCFLNNPSEDFFFPPKLQPISDEELQMILESRKSMLMLLDFQAPAVVEDVLFPQLRKAEDSARAMLERRGFRTLRSDAGIYGERAGILLEMEVWEQSKVRKSLGPPIWEADHLSKFLAVHPHPLSGPYIENGRAVVDLPRSYVTARELLAAGIQDLSLGRHLSIAIRSGHNIYVGLELFSIKDKDFRMFLARYFNARTKMC